MQPARALRRHFLSRFRRTMRGTKIKSPFEFVVSALRAADAEVLSANAMVGTLSALGEPLFQCQPPTGYGDRATAWIATGALINRLNFTQALAGGRVGGTRVDLARLGGDGADRAPNRVIALTLAGELSLSTRQALAGAVGPRASEALRTGLVLGAPEFQRR